MISASQQLRPSIPPISQCYQSGPSVSVTHQCHLSVTIIAAYQCSIINAHQCRLISASYQCPSVLPIIATSSVLPHQRTSVKAKNYLFSKFYNKNTFSNFLLFFCLFIVQKI
ncbi:unnamed protein product, partial [Staurois parvus]